MGVRIFESGKGSLRVLRMKAKKLSEPPDFETVGAMESVLRVMFVDTQLAAHHISGSLKASGRTDTDFDGKKWSGSIIYGGALQKEPAPGPPHDPVDYAIYEMSRGGTHDFYASLPAFDPLFEKAFDRHFTVNT